MNSDEEIEFLDAPVKDTNTSSNNTNNNMQFNGFGSNYEKKETKPVDEDSIPNKGPFTDIKPQSKFFTPHIEEEKKEEIKSQTTSNTLSGNRTINFSQSDASTYNSPTYNQNIGLMKRHYSETHEKIDPKKTLPKSILYMVIFAALAVIGPKFIVPNVIKYIENPLINIFPNIDKGIINTLYVIKASLTLGMLSFFIGALIYSIYNVAIQGRKLETYKDDVLKIFGVCILVSIAIAVLNAVIKIDIVTPLMRVLTLNGLLHSIKI